MSELNHPYLSPEFENTEEISHNLQSVGGFLINSLNESHAFVKSLPNRIRLLGDLSGKYVPQDELSKHRSDRFIEGMKHPTTHTCDDGVTRHAWLLAGDPDRPKREPLIINHAWGIVSRHGLGLETSALLHDALTNPKYLAERNFDHNRDLIVIGNVGVDTPPPPMHWYASTNFESMARCNLELLDAVQQTKQIDLSCFSIIGESMGTIMASNTAAFAREYGFSVKGAILLGMAGQEPESFLNLGKDFALPETRDLMIRILSTPTEHLPSYLSMLVSTGMIPPHALPVLAKQAMLISSHSFEPLLPFLENTKLEIHSGTNDFVANPSRAYDKIACLHPNTRVFEYPDESHMRLTRVNKMIPRAIISLDEIAGGSMVNPMNLYRKVTDEVEFRPSSTH